jgi:broad specificity phosphatase PhoE
MPLKRLLLIRAGETDWNLQGRWQGWVPVPLNEHGRQQVYRLAHFIRNIKPARLYSSDNRRAAHTAELLAEELGYPPVLDKRLRERSIGRWQGMILPEIRAWHPDEYARLMADPENYKIPGGESLNQVRERACAAISEIVADADNYADAMTVAVISHTTAIRAAVTALVPEIDLSGVTLGNTSVTTLRRQDNGTWMLLAANDCSHLEGLESRYMPEVEDKA